MRRLLRLLAVLALAVGLPASAQAPSETALAPLLERAAQAGAALEVLGEAEEPVALAEAVAADAAALAALDESRRDAQARAETLELDLAVRGVETARLMAALQATHRGQRVDGAALHPQGPVAAARTAAMLARLDPALETEAARIGAVLREIGRAREEQQTAAAALREGLPRLDAARARLEAVLARESGGPGCCAPGSADGDLAALARDSETLSGFAAALETAPEDATRAQEAKPMPLAWPAPGRVAQRYEARDAAGVRRPGILLGASPLALVRAPAAGVVRYAGPFLDYGYVVVLEPRRGTQVVLAGLALLRARTGDRVEAGAVLGLLGGRPGDPDEDVKAPGFAPERTRLETLYIEVRDGGRPVDPEPWFAHGGG